MAILIRRTLLRTWAPIFKQLEADGAAGGAGELGVAQADPAQRLEQDIGEGREPQPELVGAHGRRRRAIGEQVELLLLDPVLDLAAGAVDVLVQGARVDRARPAARSRRSAGWRPWADARPWRPRGASRLQLSSVRQAKSAKRRAGTALGQALGRGCGQLVGDGADQALVAREAEDVVDAVRLAPSHELVAGKARIGAQQDLAPAASGPGSGPTMRSTSSTAPADASMFERRSLAASRCRPQNTYSGR